jgi:hypothetical protein
VSATAEAKTAKTAKTYRFISKGLHFQIVHRPPLTATSDAGGMIVKDPGHIIDFGTPFRVEGADQPSGTYVTSDPEIAEWLRAQASFNVEFWESGNEPDAIHPTMAELAPVIAKATAELDVDTLRQLLEAEQGSHNRPDVLSMLEASIGQLEESTG